VSLGCVATGAVTCRVHTLSPTAALPCFTASMAYSIWKMRPWGLHVVTSVSYCSQCRGRAASRRRARWRRGGALYAHTCAGQPEQL
jgi:hypothetical protein